MAAVLQRLHSQDPLVTLIPYPYVHTYIRRPLLTFLPTCLLLCCHMTIHPTGGALARLLGASFWSPLARLSWGAYLLHPLVIYVGFFCATQVRKIATLQSVSLHAEVGFKLSYITHTHFATSLA